MSPGGATAGRRADPPPDLTLRLRRIALERQGLTGRAPFGTGRSAARRAIERLGYVQIDTISVISRAHDHVLEVRVPGYTPDVIDRLQAEGSVFEYWAHAAAYLPMRDYRFALPRMRDMRARLERWVRSRDDKLMAQVLDRVRRDGPLKTRDFAAPARTRAGWWDWKPAKRALEQLFMQGDLIVTGRAGFQKIYDLPERALPPWVDTREPTIEEYARHLIERNLDAHGFVSVRACTYQRRTPGLARAVQQCLDAAEHERTLMRLELAAPERAVYVAPQTLERRNPSIRGRAHLLSPFDNLIILRQRTERVFGFDYQLECYVPESKRRFGYFCLPILYRDRFVGRADCKAHRRDARLEVKRLFVEHPAWLGKDTDAALAAIAEALARLARACRCTAVTLTDVQPPNWQQPLRTALAATPVLASNGAHSTKETKP